MSLFDIISDNTPYRIKLCKIINYIMLSMLSNAISTSQVNKSVIQEMEEENKKCEIFFKEVENWRNLEISYITRVTDIVNNLKEKSNKNGNSPTKQENEQLPKHKIVNNEFVKLLSILLENHKKMIAKINFDIMMVNSESAEKLVSNVKRLI
jgi:hypothetical protein